ncbi:MAG: PA0069 family radical SAM protein [Planctomycetes bacterium]|nr:PA0069 family radical SAM protein [Planctomycetota bacterium]MBI3833568.1 PA0069 family radical SAM protein [Planctomycetota bacterium]
MKLRPIDNPPNPYLSQHAEWLEPPPAAKLEIYEETSGSVLTHNDSPDLGFEWSVNPYRGCQHACAYCYARPYHEYLGLGAGTDFDTKLVVKINAAELLHREFRKKSWQRELVMFSGITDCYQPIEASYGITRQCLDVCIEFKNSVGIITKNFLVVRDIDRLQQIDRVAGAKVSISIPFADENVAKLIEPQAPPPSRRFEAVRRLSEAGITVNVMVAPIIPGLNDRDIPSLLERAAAAGASSAHYTALRLSGSVRPVFIERLRKALPDRADRVLNRIREMRGGELNDSRFGHRMSGQGAYWESIKDLFELSRRRFGLQEKQAIHGNADPPNYASKSDKEQSDSSKIRNLPAPRTESSLVQLRLPFGY